MFCYRIERSRAPIRHKRLLRIKRAVRGKRGAAAGDWLVSFVVFHHTDILVYFAKVSIYLLLHRAVDVLIRSHCYATAGIVHVHAVIAQSFGDTLTRFGKSKQVEVRASLGDRKEGEEGAVRNVSRAVSSDFASIVNTCRRPYVRVGQPYRCRACTRPAYYADVECMLDLVTGCVDLEAAQKSREQCYTGCAYSHTRILPNWRISGSANRYCQVGACCVALPLFV